MEQNQNNQEQDLYGVYSENKIDSPKPKKRRFRTVFKFGIALSLLFFIGNTLLSSKTISGQGNAGGMGWLSNFSLIGQIKNLANSSEQKLKGQERGRVNILLLGIGGKDHDGGMLTDTIMLLSLDTVTKRVAMISVPRDLSVPIEGYGWRKINSINSYAEKEKPDSGGLAVSQAFSQLFAEPIDYYLRVDFEAFSKMVDDLGGVEVTVVNTLDDYSYPVLGREDNPDYYSRYEHLHVEAGTQKMDGELALKFARSRHGVKGEGSDFARARRQQLIIEAVKNQLLSTNLLFKPTLIGKMIENYQEHVSTNLQPWELMKLWGMFKDVNKDQIINKVLDNSPAGLLMDQVGLDGAYLLVPRAGDFSQVQYLIGQVFDEAPAEVKEKINEEKALITVKNGTWLNGLAGKVATDLEGLGFTIADISNAANKDFTYTVIYDFSNGQKPQSLELLKTKTKGVVAEAVPEWLNAELEKDASYTNDYQKPDFVIVLGQEQDSTKSGTKNNN